MDLARLTYFVAVARAQSFSRAAAGLNLTQPSLSRQVRLLEGEVGHRLFERTGRGATLTEAGQALLAHASDILALAERARIDLRERDSDPSGRISIGLPPRVAHVITADLVEGFLRQFPKASVTVVEDLSMRLRELMIEGRLDIALAFDPPHSPQIQQEPLVREPLVLVSRSPLPARVKLAEVARHRLVMPSGPHALRRLVDQQAQPRGLALDVVAEVDSVQTVLSLVARGLADSILPVSAVRGAATRLHVAAIHTPVIRVVLALAVPMARPGTRLSRFAAVLLRELSVRHFSGNAPGTA